MTAEIIDLAAFRAKTQRVEPEAVAPLTAEEKEALRLASRTYNRAMRVSHHGVADALRVHNDALVNLARLSRLYPFQLIAEYSRELTARRDRLAGNPRRFRESVLPDFVS